MIYPLMLLDRNMGIDLGLGNAGMTQLLLDMATICSAIQHMGGSCMPEDMAGPGLADPGPPEMARHGVMSRQQVINWIQLRKLIYLFGLIPIKPTIRRPLSTRTLKGPSQIVNPPTKGGT